MPRSILQAIALDRVSAFPSGPFVVFAEEAHEDPSDLLFMPDATAADWALIFTHAEVRRIDAGLAIVQAGEEDRALYLLTEGSVGVTLPRDESPFKTIDAPSVLGELAFFDARPRSATLVAATDVEVVRLDLAGFARLTDAAPELAHAMLLDLARILALRLRLASMVIAQLRGG
jgi:CRP/FNR family transcriptional regulator, cyclic AMP receptor protein